MIVPIESSARTVRRYTGSRAEETNLLSADFARNWLNVLRITGIERRRWAIAAASFVALVALNVPFPLIVPEAGIIGVNCADYFNVRNVRS